MKYVKYLLNLPWTLLALIVAILSIPISIDKNDNAIIVKVRTFWWHPSKGIRALTLGNVILTGRKILKNDLKHEMVHIDQHMREPLLHPFLAMVEQLRNGPKNSKYELEAYDKAGNKFIDS